MYVVRLRRSIRFWTSLRARGPSFAARSSCPTQQRPASLAKTKIPSTNHVSHGSHSRYLGTKSDFPDRATELDPHTPYPDFGSDASKPIYTPPYALNARLSYTPTPYAPMRRVIKTHLGTKLFKTTRHANAHETSAHKLSYYEGVR